MVMLAAMGGSRCSLRSPQAANESANTTVTTALRTKVACISLLPAQISVLPLGSSIMFAFLHDGGHKVSSLLYNQTQMSKNRGNINRHSSAGMIDGQAKAKPITRW